ncbi:hypothetical protein [Metasolibacillus meyeri]|uniref:hypothetical protein n=1 Tax=Metasolibacillus meyeri TaxID=1071052 RepID=UPI000D31E8A7|nr:hypothetical protein [Metasolibacillus meyeri]
MLIKNGGWSFDTDEINASITKGERDMLNAFNKYAYWRYKQIRDCVNTRKCKHMTVDKVRGQLIEERKLALTIKVLRITNEEIFYIIDYADKHLKYIK